MPGGTLASLRLGQRRAAEAGVDLGRLPFSIRTLLEAVARREDGELITRADVLALAANVRITDIL